MHGPQHQLAKNVETMSSLILYFALIAQRVYLDSRVIVDAWDREHTLRFKIIMQSRRVFVYHSHLGKDKEARSNTTYHRLHGCILFTNRHMCTHTLIGTCEQFPSTHCNGSVCAI